MHSDMRFYDFCIGITDRDLAELQLMKSGDQIADAAMIGRLVRAAIETHREERLATEEMERR